MQVDIVDNGGIEKTISFVVDKATVEKQYSNFFAAARKNYPVKGFRPGTAPDSVLRVRLGDAAKTEVAGRLVQEALTEAVRDQNLSLAGNPELTEDYRQNDQRKHIGQFKPDGSFVFVVNAEFEPTLETVVIDGLTISSPIPTVEQVVENKLELMRHKATVASPVEREVRLGDQLLADFSGTLDGAQFIGGTQEFYTLVAGDETLTPGLSAHFAGHNKGETFTFNFTMPETFSDHTVAGKEIAFECFIHSINELRLPELDDDFAKQFNANSIADLRALTANQVINSDMQMLKAQKVEEITDTLISNNPITVPKAWVQNEIQVIASRMGIKEMTQEIANALQEVAERSVKRAFILDRIYAQEPSLHFTVDEIKNILTVEGNKVGKNAEELLTLLKNSNRYEGFMSYHQQFKVIDFLLTSAKVME